jgi:aminopeptidase-like protein
MANNELSGPTVVTYLAKWLLELEQLDYTYRIVFIPETIGSITYLSLHHDYMKKNIISGFNVSCVGDERAYSYLPSRNGKTLSDSVAMHVLKHTDSNFKSYTWLDRGSDERQYCAPGIDLPIASIMRTKYGQYPEYHTSLDDLENVVTPNGLDGGYWALRRAIEAVEKNKKYHATVFCEPQMGKRGLYPTLSTKKSVKEVKLMMDLISLCDGKTLLLEVAESLNTPIWELYELIETLVDQKLIKMNE